MPDLLQFFGELRRRRVFRVAVVYAIVAWGLMEVGDLIFPALGLPDWTLTFVIVLAAFGFPIAMILAWAFDLTPAGVIRTSSIEEEGGGPSESEPRSPEVGSRADGLVVLPFENLSPNPEDEYFSDGVTEDLISQLHGIGWLPVISRTSAWTYKKKRVGTKQIASELGVAYLVEGSVRRSGARVRISAQLIDALSDRHLWAETYDRELEDIFAIQADVADRIATALRSKLSVTVSEAPDAPVRAAPEIGAGNGEPSQIAEGRALTSDLGAYDLYLRGRYHWNRRSEKDLAESAEHLLAAIDRDPEFVRARSALAETYVTMAIYGFRAAEEVLPLARREADEALTRNPIEAPALTALACVRAIYDWEWSRAAAGFASAMKANPQYPTAPQWLAMNVLVPLKRFDEAVAQLERARELDPLCISVRASFAIVDFMRGDYGRALERFGHMIRQDPHFQLAHFFGGLSALHGGDPDRGVELLEKAVNMGGWSPEVAAAHGSALVRAGREAQGREILDRLHDPGDRYVSPVRVAQLHAALMEYEDALDHLERAVEERSADLIWLDVHPGLDPIRDQERFQEVRNRIFKAETPTFSASSSK